MASTKTKANNNTSLKSKQSSTSTSDPSEFADSKVAVGAALTFIEDLQKSLPPQKYAQILDLLNKYHSHSLNERVVYQLFKNIVKGSQDEDKLLKGLERFLPEGALDGEMEEVDVVLVEDEDEGRRLMENGEKVVGMNGSVSGKGRIEDVTEQEEKNEKKV